VSRNTGWAAAAAPAASAATAACGSGCVSLYNLDYGSSYVVAAADGSSPFNGEFIDLQTASDSNPAEDWYIDFEAPVIDLYEAGLVSEAVNQHYSNDEAYEFEYTPDGQESGLCLGTPSTASNGLVLSLQPCGENADTLWINDVADQYERNVPLINGSDTNFTYPYVLTSNTTSGYLTTTELTGGDGVIDTGQYWSTEYGVLP
jgi:hypothetical protein